MRLDEPRIFSLPAGVLLALALLAIPAAAQRDPGAPDDLEQPPADAEKSPSGLVSKVLRAGTGDVRPDVPYCPIRDVPRCRILVVRVSALQP